MSNRRKEWESFCVEVFLQGMKEHQIEKYLRLVKTISLGMPLHPSTSTTSRFANLQKKIEQHRNLHKFGAFVS